MLSHHKMRGSFTVPGVIRPDWFGWESACCGQMPLDEYGARVLGKIYSAGMTHYCPTQSLVINYQQLPEIVWSMLLDFFQVEHTPAQVENMHYVAQFYSKTPGLYFSDDTRVKNSKVTENIHQLAHQWVTPAYEQLEALRSRQIYTRV
jgi:hypothetical protein